MRLRSLGMLAVALLIPAVSATQVAADPPVYWGTMTFDGIYYGGAGGGGEFRWTTTKSPAGKGDLTLKGPGSLNSSQFLTFCVETTEHISNGEKVFAFLNDRSKNTNITLKNGTAWVYSQFVNGALSTLSPYSYATNAGNARTSDANSLQNLIWYFQGQSLYSSLDAQSLAWLAEAQAALGGAGNEFLTDNIGKVRILNCWQSLDGNGNGTGARQDMLVMIPLPAPVWMAGIGLFGVVGGTIYRRRFSGRNLSDCI